MLVAAYLGYVIWVAFRHPKAAPALVTTAEDRANLARDVLVSVLPTLALIIAVLGSILGGIATPTESASVGAVGAMLLAALRGRFGWSNLKFGDGIDRRHHVDDLHHPDRGLGVQPGVPACSVATGWSRTSSPHCPVGAPARSSSSWR